MFYRSLLPSNDTTWASSGGWGFVRQLFDPNSDLQMVGSSGMKEVCSQLGVWLFGFGSGFPVCASATKLVCKGQTRGACQLYPLYGRDSVFTFSIRAFSRSCSSRKSAGIELGTKTNAPTGQRLIPFVRTKRYEIRSPSFTHPVILRK